MRGNFSLQEMRQDSPLIYRFFSNSRFGGKVGQSIHGGGNKQNERRGNIFAKMGNIFGILQGDKLLGWREYRYKFIVLHRINLRFEVSEQGCFWFD